MSIPPAGCRDDGYPAGPPITKKAARMIRRNSKRMGAAARDALDRVAAETLSRWKP